MIDSPEGRTPKGSALGQSKLRHEAEIGVVDPETTWSDSFDRLYPGGWVVPVSRKTGTRRSFSMTPFDSSCRDRRQAAFR